MYRKVHPVEKGDKVNYVVRWYVNTTADDAMGRPDHNPQHFITHFCAECRNETQDERGVEKKIGDDKEHTPPTVQANTLMRI